MKLRYLIFLVCLAPDFASAQVYFCDGKWTTTACAGAKPLTGDQRTVMKPAEAQALSRKRSLLHDLTMKNISAREELDVQMDLSGVEEFCGRTEVSLDACRVRVQEVDDRLNQQINSVRMIRAQEDANAQKAREQETKKTESVAVQGGGNITIIDNRPIIYQPPQVIHVEQNVIIKDGDDRWRRRDDFDNREYHPVPRRQGPIRSSTRFAPNSPLRSSAPSPISAPSVSSTESR